MMKHRLLSALAVLLCLSLLGGVCVAEEIAVGDIVTFGHYEQDNDLENGTEPLEWQVLEVTEDGYAVLLSRYVLCAQIYDYTHPFTTWEESDLRAWLNNEFYEAAFSQEERASIRLTDVINDDNPYYGTEGGNDTQDYVYLLSVDEVQRYFADTLEMINDDTTLGRSGELQAMCTPYAEANGSCPMLQGNADHDQKDYSYTLKAGACSWWLRTVGMTSGRAASVLYWGDVMYYGESIDTYIISVRPVIAIRIN